MITASTTSAIKHIRRQPPLRAMYLLFLTSVNFSPFGPVTSEKLYCGGDFSKLCLGGFPKAHPRLKVRLLRGLFGIVGVVPSSAITESLASPPTSELARLRFEPLAECRGRERSMKSIGIVKYGLAELLYPVASISMARHSNRVRLKRRGTTRNTLHGDEMMRCGCGDWALSMTERRLAISFLSRQFPSNLLSYWRSE